MCEHNIYVRAWTDIGDQQLDELICEVLTTNPGFGNVYMIFLTLII